MAHVVMAYVVMAYVVMAYVVMAYVVVAGSPYSARDAIEATIGPPVSPVHARMHVHAAMRMLVHRVGCSVTARRRTAVQRRMRTARTRRTVLPTWRRVARTVKNAQAMWAVRRLWTDVDRSERWMDAASMCGWVLYG